MSKLDLISYIAIVLGVLSAMFILIDVVKNPQPMKIMSIVWPIQGLYLGPFAIWFYWVMGRQKSDNHDGHEHHYMMEHAEEHDLDVNHKHMENDHSNHMDMDHGHSMHGNMPFYQSVFVSTSHCSSGCTIGDLIGAPIVFLLGVLPTKRGKHTLSKFRQ